MDYHDFEALPQMLSDYALDIDNQKPSVADLHGGLVMLERLMKAAREVQIALESEMLERVASEPVMQGGRVYALEKEFKQRPVQSKIDLFIVRCLMELGVDEVAAWKATGVVHDLYISPSTLPKVTGLKRIGLPKDEATTREFTRKRLTIADYGPPREDDE